MGERRERKTSTKRRVVIEEHRRESIVSYCAHSVTSAMLNEIQGFVQRWADAYLKNANVSLCF